MDTGVDGDLILLDQRHVDDGRAGSQSTTVRRDLTGNPSVHTDAVLPHGGATMCRGIIWQNSNEVMHIFFYIP